MHQTRNTAGIDRPIRILHFIPWLAGGGAEVGLRELIRGLSPDRFQHHVVCFECSGSRREDFDALGVSITEVGKGKADSIRSVGALLRLIRLARQWHPDIVHGVVFEGQVFGTLAGRLARVPVVITEENTHPGGGRGRSRLTRVLLRQLLIRNDAVVAIGPAVAKYLVEQNRLPPQLVRVILHGVRAPSCPSTELLVAERKLLGIPEEADVVGTVCRLDDPCKRVSNLIRAVAQLSDALPRLHLLVVGDGPDRAMLEQLTRSLNLENRVHFAGYRQDPSVCFHLMQVFALPSSFEGFGIVFVEAAAAGLPCVGTRVGGIVDAVEDQVTGILVPPDDVAALGEAIRRLMNDPSLRKQMGEAGKQRANRLHSVDDYGKAFSNLFEEALTRRLGSAVL